MENISACLNPGDNAACNRCKRKTIHRKRDWFGAWESGSPTMVFDCSLFLPENQQNLFGDDDERGAKVPDSKVRGDSYVHSTNAVDFFVQFALNS